MGQSALSRFASRQLFEAQPGCLALDFGRAFAQPIGDFPGRGVPVKLSQHLELLGRPAGFFPSADTHFAKLSLNRDKRAFQPARQNHHALSGIPLFQKIDFLFCVRPLLIWSFCDFSALPIPGFLTYTVL